MCKILLFCFASVLCFMACSSTIPYTPTKSLPTQEAIEIIQRTLDRQPRDHSPLEVLVDEEKTRFVIIERFADAWTWPLRLHERPVRITLYYDEIGRMKLSKRPNWYVASFYDRSDRFICEIFAPDKEAAESLLEAIATLSRPRS